MTAVCELPAIWQKIEWQLLSEFSCASHTLIKTTTMSNSLVETRKHSDGDNGF